MTRPRDRPPPHEVVLQHFEAGDDTLEPLTTETLTYREIRDSLWLANRIHPDVESSRTPRDPVAPARPDDEPAADERPLPDSTPEPPTEPEPRGEPEDHPTRQWTPGPQTLTSTGAVGEDDPRRHAASAWPTVPAMPERRDISRALRPLTRAFPSPRNLVLDEEATAVRAATDGLWLPELKPLPWRRFDVALVVDATMADDLWRRTTQEFRAVLEQQGAFRDVRMFELNTDSPDPADLSLRSEGGATHDTGFLVEPNGTRIVLVFTDTTGKAWHSGAVPHVLHGWGRRMPVAIVHSLHQRLWSWGGVTTRRMRLSAPAPGAPNHRLRTDVATDDGVVPVPVLGLSKSWMAGWAKLITSPGAEWVEMTATLVSTYREDLQPTPAQDDGLTAAERVARFRTFASVEAFHLAGLLAASPLSPPLITRVQRVLLPNSSQSTLAEVMLGGIVRKVPPANGTAATVIYDFHDGVREELLATCRRVDTARVAQVLDDYAGTETPPLRDLREVLANPTHAPAVTVSPQTKPYLKVQAAVLRALAGPYSTRATQVRAALSIDQTSPQHDMASAPPGRQPIRDPGEHSAMTTTDSLTTTADMVREPHSQPPQGVEDVTASGTHITTGERRTATTQPQIWGAVPLRNPDFVGRAELLEQLRVQVAESGTAAVLPKALHGMGGVGKSQTVIEYIHRHASEYDLVWWIPAEQPAQIKTSFVELAKRLGVATAGSADTAVPAVLEELRTYDPAKRWILVFDNADSPNDVRQFFPAGSGHIVVTSRNSEWQGFAQRVAVEIFTRAESIELLSKRGGEIDEVEADALAEALGDLPLAVEQAAAWRATTGMQVAEYLDLLAQNRTELLSSDGSDDKQAPVVAAVWNVPLDRLRKQHPDALQLLQVCAFFGPEPISQRLFRGGRDAPVPSELGEALRDPIKLARAVRQINRYSLAKLDHRTNSLQLHRLVQSVLKNSLTTDDQETMRHAVHVLLGNGDPGDPESRVNWARYSELLPHALMSKAVQCQDRLVRSLIDNLVVYMLNVGDFGGARDLAEQAVASWQAHDASDLMTLTMARRLAVALRRLGNIDEAIKLNEKTRALLVAEVGENDESMLEMLDTVAADRRSEGRFREETELQNIVYTKSRALLGENDPTTLRYAHNLAGCMRLMGQFDEARALDEDTMRRRTAVLGIDHSQTLGSRNALCMDLRECGYYVEAARDQEQALEYQRDVLGEDNPRVIGATRNLSVSLRKAGEHLRAKALAEDCLNRYQRRHGDNHFDTITALMNLSTDLRHLGDLDGALERAQTSFEQFHDIHGPHHPYTLIATMNLAVIHRLRGELVLAMDIDTNAHATLLEVFDADHPFALVAATNLASDLAAMGETERAKAIDEDTLERSRRTLGAEHPSTLAVALNLAIDLHALGDETNAAKLHGQTVASFRKVLGDDHPATIAAAQYTRANCDTDTMQL
ncbi:FxSxx-COOH system tetratricopeptide repeat protein [Umezawaea sp. NPDC059074]|uniref:FxSxx-COOH system tetratricopeptide repeat protein n=1 Tax=Umezawaea sp. NPDC059074 TaxID=3346716 RepID=UPI0036B1BE9E